MLHDSRQESTRWILNLILNNKLQFHREEITPDEKGPSPEIVGFARRKGTRRGLRLLCNQKQCTRKAIVATLLRNDVTSSMISLVLRSAGGPAGNHYTQTQVPKKSQQSKT